MIRLFVFFIKLAVLVTAAVWLADHPGQVSFTWQGYEVSTSVAVLVVAAAVFVAVLLTLHTVWLTLVSVPRPLTLAHLSRRQRKGYLALTQGLVAVAAGDATGARRFAVRAEKFLNEPSLTLLLQAQAAQLNGDELAAERYFNAMLEKPGSSFLGLRGLLTQAMKKGDQSQALQLARRARLLQPKAGWVLNALIELEARNDNWEAALTALGTAIRQGAVTPERGRKLRATLLIGQSQQAEANGAQNESLRLARRAHEVSPSYAPAAIRYALLLVESRQFRLAQKIVERSWKSRPHPELARLYAQAGGSITPTQQVKRFERLKSFNPEDPESRVALAEKAITAQLWGIARDQLVPLVAATPSAAVCRLMAELEDKELANARSARDWLARAATAPADPVWACTACQTVSNSWSPVCRSCNGLAGLEWGRVPAPLSQLLPPAASA